MMNKTTLDDWIKQLSNASEEIANTKKRKIEEVENDDFDLDFLLGDEGGSDVLLPIQNPGTPVGDMVIAPVSHMIALPIAPRPIKKLKVGDIGLIQPKKVNFYNNTRHKNEYGGELVSLDCSGVDVLQHKLPCPFFGHSVIGKSVLTPPLPNLPPRDYYNIMLDDIRKKRFAGDNANGNKLHGARTIIYRRTEILSDKYRFYDLLKKPEQSWTIVSKYDSSNPVVVNGIVNFMDKLTEIMIRELSRNENNRELGYLKKILVKDLLWNNKTYSFQDVFDIIKTESNEIKLRVSNPFHDELLDIY